MALHSSIASANHNWKNTQIYINVNYNRDFNPFVLDVCPILCSVLKHEIPGENLC